MPLLSFFLELDLIYFTADRDHGKENGNYCSIFVLYRDKRKAGSYLHLIFGFRDWVGD